MKLSISRIKLFKSCRRAYELKYVHGLTPVESAEALRVGSNFHAKIEELNNTGEIDTEDLSRESAMAVAYKKYVYPKFKVEAAEEWNTASLDGVDLISRVDGISNDGRLVEYKTTSAEITDEYEYNLMWDEQIPMYMYMTGTREVWYVVVRKPSIRQKKDESDEDFFNRMVEWYDSDTDKKIRVMLIERTDEEINEFVEELRKISFEIGHCSNFYRNPTYCNCWGRRCEYSSICLNYDPSQEYIGFTKEV